MQLYPVARSDSPAFETCLIRPCAEHPNDRVNNWYYNVLEIAKKDI